MRQTMASRVEAADPRRVQPGRHVLNWMQAAQRAEHNPALEHAIAEANRLDQPLLVCFGLTPHLPEANERHVWFMREDLRLLTTPAGPLAVVTTDEGQVAGFRL